MLRHMSTTIENISKALNYDAAEISLAAGGALSSVYAFAAYEACKVPVEDTDPESARTVLAHGAGLVMTRGPRFGGGGEFEHWNEMKGTR